VYIATLLRELTCHYGITQCSLPPGRGDIPAFIPSEAGIRFSDPGGMQGWDNLCMHCSKGVQPVPKTAYRSSHRDKHDRPLQDSNQVAVTSQSDALTTRPLHCETLTSVTSRRRHWHSGTWQSVCETVATTVGDTSCCVATRRVNLALLEQEKHDCIFCPKHILTLSLLLQSK